MSENETRIQRSSKATIGYAGGGLLACGLSALLFWSIVGGPITFGIALLPGILGLILLWMAIAGSGVAPCPGCGAQVEGLSTGSNDGVLCSGCRKFLEGREGRLRLTDPSRVADSPIFGAVLPESFTWPEHCCLCSSPSSRREPISVSVPSAASAGKGLAVTALTGGVITQSGGGTRYTIEVPHCAEHKEGAFLGAGSGKGVQIRFRSYPFLREFCELNKITPG